MIEIRISVDREAFKRFAFMSPNVIKNLDNAVKQAANFIRNTILKKLRQTGKGRVYARYRGGQTPIIHRASSPGSPPATDTGRLIGSIRTNFPESMTAEIGSDVNYSQFLELGTSKMAKRPWLLSSLEENQNRISDLIDKAISDALN